MENKQKRKLKKAMPPPAIGSRLELISGRWFLREPVLLMALLSHDVSPNPAIAGIRCGKGAIEYNPAYVNTLTDDQFEEQLKAEVIRILLRHPYREPAGRNKRISYMASNITLNENYCFADLPYKAKDFWQDSSYFKQSFEFYYRAILDTDGDASSDNSGGAGGDAKSADGNESSSGGGGKARSKSGKGGAGKESKSGGAGDASSAQSDGDASSDETTDAQAAENAALWTTDEFMDLQVSEVIKQAQASLSWGSLAGNLAGLILATLKPVIDYRKILNSFRASVLSSDKVLTRFRPSRRYGAQYMGKKLAFTTSLLIGIDVSGSIDNDELDVFYSTINRFFKYGIQSLDVLQFDTEVKGEPETIKKACKTIPISGRGGTCFQPLIDYFASQSKKRYDGLIIFTDGYAALPQVKAVNVRKTLWVCNSRANYERHKKWMSERGRCCWVE
ncbi:DUF2201 family putative metallopeptidase [Breznakiellaceae bacterium SP9]